MTQTKLFTLNFVVKGLDDAIDEIVYTVMKLYTDKKIDLLNFIVEGGE